MNMALKKGKNPMKRVLTIAAALCVLALGVTSTGSAYTTSCPAYSQQIVSVTYDVTGESVTGVNGNVWASAGYTRTLQIYRVSKNSYCATWRDSGTFLTIAGPSPGGTPYGWVDDGVAGTLTRTAVTTNFTAKWQPSVATSGSLGTYAAPVDWTSFYFNNVRGLDLVWFANLYGTPANGSWGSRTGFPSYCDILSSATTPSV
jgi:hypothetical protein